MITTKNITMLLGLLFMVLVASGCQMVHVMDPNGDPISWAKVQVAPSASERGEDLSMPFYTDLLGNAMLPKGMSETSEYFIVSKEGFRTATLSRGVDSKVEIQLAKQPDLAPPAETSGE